MKRKWKRKKKTTRNNKTQLRREAEAGKCLLILNGHGEVDRIVEVAALCITNGEGQILCQVGLQQWEQTLETNVPQRSPIRNICETSASSSFPHPCVCDVLKGVCAQQGCQCRVG